jgi:SAM-dependent methyltransferase
MSSHISIVPRKCPVCLGENNKLVFRQEFSSYSEGTLMNGYDLVVCTKCGAGFSDNIPEQIAFDRYYADMSKYERNDKGGELAYGNIKFFSEITDCIEPYVKKSESIVDIGCATGGLLAELKKRGYEDLMGMDPSAVCAAIAKRLFNIHVKTLTISSLGEVDDRFDMIMLTGVLEHLHDVEKSLKSLINLLKPEGRIFFVVPDASRYHKYFSAPFQFFSMEHVNYFSPHSLSNLLQRHGLQTIFINRTVGYLGPNSVEPVLMGLFQKKSLDKIPLELTCDQETEPALEEYIKISRILESRIDTVIQEIVESQSPLLIWGTGTHTLRLLKKGNLSKANIVAFIDSNPNYQGKKLNGIPIISPNSCKDDTVRILISSQVAESDIKNYILNNLQLKNPIICLYENNHKNMVEIV